MRKSTIWGFTILASVSLFFQLLFQGSGPESEIRTEHGVCLMKTPPIISTYWPSSMQACPSPVTRGLRAAQISVVLMKDSPHMYGYYGTCEELPTDEAICGWNDPGIPELNSGTWNSTSSFVQAMYYRIFYQIPLCNEFIRFCSDDWMNEKVSATLTRPPYAPTRQKHVSCVHSATTMRWTCSAMCPS